MINVNNNLVTSRDTKNPHITENKFKCEKCEKTFNRSDKLKLHINSWTKLLHSGFSVIKESLEDEIPVKLISKHKDTQQAKEQSYSCSFCPKTFSNNSHLIRHTKTHVLTDCFECDYCGEKFSRKDKLQSHVRNHPFENF